MAKRSTFRKRNYPQSRWWHAVADADGIKSIAYTGTLKGAESAGRKIEAKGYRALLSPATEQDAKGWRKEWRTELKNPDWGQVLVPLSAITPVHEVRMFDWKDKLIQEMRENGWVGRPLLVLREGKGDFGALTGSHRFGALTEMYRRKEWPKNLPYGKVPVVILEKSDFKNREGNNGWDMIHNAVSDEDRAYVVAQFLKNDESHSNSPAIQIMAEELARDHESWTQHERVSPAMDRLRDKLSPFDYMRAQVMANPKGKMGLKNPKRSRARYLASLPHYAPVAGHPGYLISVMSVGPGGFSSRFMVPGGGSLGVRGQFSSSAEAYRAALDGVVEYEAKYPQRGNPSGDIQDRFSKQLTDHLWPKVRKARSKEELHEEIHRAMHQVAEPGRIGNPDTSAEMFEDFHGEPPSTVTEFNETEHYSDDLAKLGTLVELKVRTITGLEATLGFNGSAPELASTPDGRQLYFLGGDQSLDLDKLKMGGAKWERDFMVIGDLDELTYRTAKGFDHFKLSDYYHKLGEESGHMPTLIYDRLNQRLQVAGGRYHNEKSGIND